MFELPRTEQPGHDHVVCPDCGTELCGGQIYGQWSKSHAHFLGTNEDGTPTLEARREYAEGYGATPERDRCGGREVGIEFPYDHPERYDGVSAWLMPCCGHVLDRWTGKRREDLEPVNITPNCVGGS